MNNLFRKLPKLDILMKNEKLDECREKLNYNTLYTLVKNEIDSFREKIKNFAVREMAEKLRFSKLFRHLFRVKAARASPPPRP